MCVYMRPWTLNRPSASNINPLLSDLGKCEYRNGTLTPVWMDQEDIARMNTQHLESTGAAQRRTTAVHAKKRLRAKTSQDQKQTNSAERISYATSWDTYIDGNVVSETSRRYIINLLATTCTARAEHDEESSGESDQDAWKNVLRDSGSMEDVRLALAGIASRSADEGIQGLGRHSRTIRLGKQLWQTHPLNEEAKKDIRERFFDDGTFPPPQTVKKALEMMKKAGEEERPAPDTTADQILSERRREEY